MKAPKKHFTGLGNKIKCNKIFEQVPWYRYYNNVAGMIIGTLTKSLHNITLDK